MSSAAPGREVGRPRVFSDQRIFQAVGLVLGRDGVGELTLDAVAAEVGCTRQALVRRFGSKELLLLAFLVDLVSRSRPETPGDVATPGSALATLRAWFIQLPDVPFGPVSDARAYAHVLAFLLTVGGEQRFAPHVATLHRYSLQAIADALDLAVERQELVAGDTTRLAGALFDLWVGAIMLWCYDPTTDPTATLTQGFDLIIEPRRRGSGVAA